MKILVTGSTDGIGLRTAEILAQHGHQLIIHGRDDLRVERAVKSIPNSVGMVADLSSMDEVKGLVQQIQNVHSDLDILINNAGVFCNELKITPDNFEMTVAVNHFAPALLTHHLLPNLKGRPQARVIVVSSIAHNRGKINFDSFHSGEEFEPYPSYADSKLANVLFVNQLAENLKGTSVSAFSLHPGVITTKLLKAGFNTTGDSLSVGAATSVFLATDPDIVGLSGEYFDKSQPARKSSAGRDKQLSKKFWDYTFQKLAPWL